MKLKRRYKLGLKSFINEMELSNERLELSFGPFNRICYTPRGEAKKYLGAFDPDDFYHHSYSFGILHRQDYRACMGGKFLVKKLLTLGLEERIKGLIDENQGQV